MSRSSYARTQSALYRAARAMAWGSAIRRGPHAVAGRYVRKQSYRLANRITRALLRG